CAAPVTHHRSALPARQRPVGRAMASPRHPALRAPRSHLTDPATQAPRHLHPTRSSPTKLSCTHPSATTPELSAPPDTLTSPDPLTRLGQHSTDPHHKQKHPDTRLQEGQYECTVPSIADRAQQNRVRNALEPEWEARLDAHQYGFRPGRGCHDAISVIHSITSGRNARRRWVLDADLESAFDRIDHNHRLGLLGSFPAREQIRAWLKAGVADRNRYAPTSEGTPQGSLCSAEHKPPYAQCRVMRSAGP